VVGAALAALSADPETIDELQAAMARFHKAVGEGGWLGHLLSEVGEAPADAERWVMDLAARLVVPGASDDLEIHEGSVAYHDGHEATDVWLRYHFSDDWLIVAATDDWETQADTRRRQRAGEPPMDARAVLYGKIADFAAAECLRAAASGSRPPDVPADIHVRWLMTPRDDLRGQTPREVLLARQEFLDADLEDRRLQWSKLGECPPGLRPESVAYRYAGFGTHEIVMYYELVRDLLDDCWSRVQDEPDRPLVEETARVRRRQADWLSTTQEDLDGYAPADVIERERARIPLVVEPGHAVVDHDCPLCRMMAESEGPMFLHLDGCGMDDDFAFSFCLTREEWETEQRNWASLRDTFESQQRSAAADDRPLVAVGPEIDDGSVLLSHASPALLIFGIGARLAELIADLKQSPGDTTTQLISTLNRDFANLRETVASESESLVAPVAEQFQQRLDDVADAHPNLAERAAYLQRQVTGLIDQATAGGS
jgi:hypothetical protein